MHTRGYLRKGPLFLHLLDILGAAWALSKRAKKAEKEVSKARKGQFLPRDARHLLSGTESPKAFSLSLRSQENKVFRVDVLDPKARMSMSLEGVSKTSG